MERVKTHYGEIDGEQWSIIEGFEDDFLIQVCRLKGERLKVNVRFEPYRAEDHANEPAYCALIQKARDLAEEYKGRLARSVNETEEQADKKTIQFLRKSKGRGVLWIHVDEPE